MPTLLTIVQNALSAMLIFSSPMNGKLYLDTTEMSRKVSLKPDVEVRLPILPDWTSKQPVGTNKVAWTYIDANNIPHPAQNVVSIYVSDNKGDILSNTTARIYFNLGFGNTNNYVDVTAQHNIFVGQ